jgi:hypothetical protein
MVIHPLSVDPTWINYAVEGIGKGLTISPSATTFSPLINKIPTRKLSP